MKKCGFLDGLLYRPRHYISLRLVNMCGFVDPRQLVQLRDFRVFFFYRKVIQEFNDNWISPKPLFHFVQQSNCNNLPFYIPPFFLYAQRVSAKDLETIENIVPYIGKATQDFYNPRNLQTWLLALATNIQSQELLSLENREPSNTTILGLPSWGWSRIVARFSAGNRKNTNLLAAIARAANIGETLAINSGELMAPETNDIPHVKPFRRMKNIYLLIGGKDMLALDWLPFISKFLHRSISQSSQRTTSNIQCCYHSAFLMYEYPGYGFSAGLPSPTACLNSSVSSLKALLNTLNPMQKSVDLVIVAYSLGCGVALNTANHVLAQNPGNLRLSKIVLLAPPTTIPACAANLLRVPTPLKTIAINLLEKIQSQSTNWDNVSAMELLATSISKTVQTLPLIPSIHILHGAKDSMVDPNMGKTLYQTAIDTVNKILKDDNPHTVPVLNNITYRLLPNATHGSIAADPVCQAEVHPLIFDPFDITPLPCENENI